MAVDEDELRRGDLEVDGLLDLGRGPPSRVVVGVEVQRSSWQKLVG